MEQLKSELQKLNDQEFEKEKKRNQMNLKRLYLKLHNLTLNVNEVDEETDYYVSNWESKKENDLNNMLYNEHLNNLAVILSHIEKKNIELEEKCLSVPAIESNSHSVLKSVVDELHVKFMDEKEKNKKIGLYIKKEFVNSKTEEIEKLKNEIKETNEGIEKELELIEEYENRETEIIQNISVLGRLIAGKKG